MRKSTFLPNAHALIIIAIASISFVFLIVSGYSLVRAASSKTFNKEIPEVKDIQEVLGESQQPVSTPTAQPVIAVIKKYLPKASTSPTSTPMPTTIPNKETSEIKATSSQLEQQRKIEIDRDIEKPEEEEPEENHNREEDEEDER